MLIQMYFDTVAQLLKTLLGGAVACNIGQYRGTCECIIFDGWSGKTSNGTFSSPDFPTPYEPNLNCLLYVFKTIKGNVVELTFEKFELQPPKENGNSR
uniref:CUB domain-containing protein n=1 Tax=Romanomermis culicivorax TaxID=13658 RepID=A0A915LBA0_ROMCU